jgi:hypothetical protein
MAGLVAITGSALPATGALLARGAKPSFEPADQPSDAAPNPAQPEACEDPDSATDFSASGRYKRRYRRRHRRPLALVQRPVRAGLPPLLVVVGR